MRPFRFAIAVIVFVGMPALALAAGPPVLLPVDEAPSRPDFFSYRAHLQAALASRDTAAVLAAADSAILLSFGGDGGIEDMKRMWLGGNPDFDLWKELGSALALGGSFIQPATFAAPYVYSVWPDSLGAFDHVAVTGSNVRVRSEPRVGSAALDTLSFSIVKVSRRLPGRWTEGWIPVELKDGRPGHISSSFARSPVGYRALFNRTARGWKMTALVAGD